MDQSPLDFLGNDDLDDWSAEAASVQLVCPIKLFADWFSRQSHEVAAEIANEAKSFLAEDELFQHYLAPDVLGFCEVTALTCWFSGVRGTLGETLNRISILCGMVDVLTHRFRSPTDDRAQWKRQTARYRERSEAAGWNGQTYPTNVIAPTAERVAVREAVRERAWGESAASWLQVRNSILGQEALSCWYEIARWQQT